MAKYILKRLGYIIIVFFLLSILLFGIFKMVPGDPARLMVEGQKQSVSPEQYEMLYQQARVRLGLDKPIPVQYLSWMGNILQGDFGYSTVYRIPVKELIGPPMKNTIALNVVYYIFLFAIGIPLGIKCAVKKDTVFDVFLGGRHRGNLQHGKSGRPSKTCHDRHKTVFHFFAVFGIQSVIFVILFGVRQRRMFANHHPSARSRADYSACLSFRTSLENHGALARNARRRNADARCGDYHILCHTQKTRRHGNPCPRFGTGIIRRTRSRFYLILSFLSFCFLFFDGNDKYYRLDNNHPDASGQYYDDFGNLSKRRLVPFGIFRRAKEKREIAVGQFFKTRLVNPAVLCEVDGFPRYANR